MRRSSPRKREAPGTPSPAPPFVLALDIGSTSIRARLFDARAVPVPGADLEVQRAPAADGVEDAATLARCAEEVIDGALANAGRAAAEIGAFAADTLVGNVMGIDAKGRPTTPLYTYAHGAPAPDVETLRQALDAEAAYQRTGCPFHTSYQAPRLMWLRRAHPDLYARTARWVDFATFLYRRWFADPRAPASYSVASWSGMFDRHALAWDGPTCEFLELDADALPPLSDYDSPLQGLAPAWARRWPQLAGKPFFLAVGDGAGANIGSGCAEPGDVALTIGTTGALRAVAAGAPMAPKGLWAYRVDRDLSLVGGAITDAGSLMTWLRSTLRGLDGGSLGAALEKLPPDGHGLTVLPFLRGERSPGWATTATATWTGIRASTTGAEMIRAALEAVAYRFRLIADRLYETGGLSDEIVAGGRVVTSLPVWIQILADVLQTPVVESRERGNTGRGVAILALKAMGILRSLSDLPAARGARFEPDPASSAAYAAGLARHRVLYDTLLG